ncbi:hypothetical protein [Bradyrhizobium elkanii]|uniref:hypothetical protein n=1 Tax=Bradyrhizobium elkanii TaxID=29448 RepID=UPI00209FC3D8|nr:hypothetical protein [Bradyrhizobium elkanii]MCP1969689.1 hypothetical protein [Bradyrhizobium elkanii]MCS4108803.1 hypothetical protein [Bradyrhizobium elkanii]
MAQAAHQSITKPLSSLFRDPVLRAAFKAAEDDGLTGELVNAHNPRTLDGGAAETIPAPARRVLVEA